MKPDCERTSLKALKIVVRNFTKHSHHDFYICTYITDYLNYLEHFYKTAQSSSICDFYNNLENSIYHVELRKALSLIHEHKYQGALDYLKDKGEGIFKNGDVSINNAIREYCINQLS